MFLREVGRIGAALEMLAPMDASPGVYINRAFLFAMTGELRIANETLDSLKAVQPAWERDVAGSCPYGGMTPPPFSPNCGRLQRTARD